MAEEVISHWVKKAKKDYNSITPQNGVNVIRRLDKNRGQLIMEISDKIWPSLMKLFGQARGEDGMLMQPAHVRGIALNVAQDLLKQEEFKNKKA